MKRIMCAMVCLLLLTACQAREVQETTPVLTRAERWQDLYDGALAEGWTLVEQWVCVHGGPKYQDTLLEKAGKSQLLCGYTHEILEE